ncbi:hypothetical protein [Arthrobacter sp. FW306-2-2C-D06B]|uniref:hypothetical protein n=1 Tax=Arthrobacter sp. FW306-2-2C-D06B TaxID=2879618 RepID=UPI001F1ED490|nr:hypothetical protein [Arthrobacter sp. FW306-2-2C-D06B]UKA57512.1 hypothetical protein LFT47_14580 [Arthrobacter sp. FW306-2-2C-D06B]
MVLKNEDLADGAPFPGKTIAHDYVHCTHPETGLEVVFMPGEALPDFAAAVQEAKDKAPAMPVVQPPKGRRAVSKDRA